MSQWLDSDSTHSCIHSFLLIMRFVFSLQALSNEANEMLPVFNKASSKFYKTSMPLDWSSQCGASMPNRQLSTIKKTSQRISDDVRVGQC